MIIYVEVYIPVLNDTYDFQVENTVTILQFVQDVCDIVGEKMRTTNKKRAEDFLLCNLDHQMRYGMEYTLKQAGIKTGSRLILL